MRALVKVRLLLPVAAATAALFAAGCGGGESSSSDPATLAPPKSPLFIEVAVQPGGEVQSNIESLAQSIAGIDDLGGLIVSELESSADSDDEELDFEKEIAPWLGEKGSMVFQEYDGEDFTGYGVAVQSTDAGATQDFIDKQAEADDEVPEEGSYEGVDYQTDEDGDTVGLIGDFLVIAEGAETFEAMVDASDGESLADVDAFSNTVAAAPSDSFADVYVDVGGLIEQSGGAIDPEAKQFLDSAGIEPADATAVASLIPGADQIEIDFSSDLSGENPPTGDASALLGSLPGDSVAAFAAAGFGESFGEALDEIDANGISGEVPPNQFKSTLKEAGIDVEKIAASIGDLAVFAAGNSERSLAGAAVLTTEGSSEAANTVANVGTLLRATGTPGVTAISGKASGFSVRSADLGPKPLVVAAEGERIAIAYGLPAAKQALATDTGDTLADNAVYKEAVGALGDTPIGAFVDGPAALQLASALVPPDEEDFREAKRYLTKIDYLAIGTGSSGDLTTAKLIAGIGK
jgi:hypothetical protein